MKYTPREHLKCPFASGPYRTLWRVGDSIVSRNPWYVDQLQRHGALEAYLAGEEAPLRHLRRSRAAPKVDVGPLIELGRWACERVGDGGGMVRAKDIPVELGERVRVLTSEFSSERALADFVVGASIVGQAIWRAGGGTTDSYVAELMAAHLRGAAGGVS